MIYAALVLIGLTLTYALTVASLAWEDLLTGFILACVLLGLYRWFVLPRALPSNRYVLHILANMPLLLWLLLVDIVRGTWQVMSIVLGLRPLSSPGMLKIPLTNHGPGGVAIVAFLVTLSPGSFLVAIDWDERTMLVHFIDTSDPDQLRSHIERYYALWEYDVPDSTPGMIEGKGA